MVPRNCMYSCSVVCGTSSPRNIDPTNEELGVANRLGAASTPSGTGYVGACCSSAVRLPCINRWNSDTHVKEYHPFNRAGSRRCNIRHFLWGVFSPLESRGDQSTRVCRAWNATE